MWGKVNKKSLFSYLIITFALTIVLVVIMVQKQMVISGQGSMSGQLLITALMFVPALATFITRRFITHEGWASAGLKWGKFRDYFQVGLLIPVLFIIIFILTYILGAQPDFDLSVFTSSAGLDLPAPAPYMIAGIFLLTLFITPFVNSIAGLGEELGWRGHLLSHLLPLGQKKALLISSLIWGLWHAPLVVFLGFGGYNNVVAGALFFTAMLTMLGIYFGYLRLKSGSTILAAWAHGVFNSQSYGLWLLIFPAFDSLVGGVTGLAGLAVMWGLAWYSFKLLEKKPELVNSL